MILSRRLTGALLAALTLVVACSSSGAALTTPPGGATSAPAGSSVTIGVTTSTTLGAVLTGPTGLTLYTHAGDSATSSTCTGACATAWPPLLLPSGAHVALAPGVSGAVATFTRGDGSGAQVTFDGLPLYYWQSDKAPGEVAGQGIDGFTVASPGGAASGSPTPTATYDSGY